jgi:hypothetical protein
MSPPARSPTGAATALPSRAGHRQPRFRQRSWWNAAGGSRPRPGVDDTIAPMRMVRWRSRHRFGWRPSEQPSLSQGHAIYPKAAMFTGGPNEPDNLNTRVPSPLPDRRLASNVGQLGIIGSSRGGRFTSSARRLPGGRCLKHGATAPISVPATVSGQPLLASGTSAYPTRWAGGGCA